MFVLAVETVVDVVGGNYLYLDIILLLLGYYFVIKIALLIWEDEDIAV